MDERQENARPRPASGWDKRVFALVVLAVLGAWISLTLTGYHLSEGQSSSGVFKAVCEMSGGGCNQVLQSPWSMLPRRIPTAFAGLVYFSALALWYLLIGLPRRSGRGWYAPVFVLHLLGALISLLLIGVMAFQMKALCGWCVLVHLINFAMFALAWKLWPRGTRSAGPADQPSWPPARLGVVSLLLMVGLGIYWNQWLVNKYILEEAGHISGDTDLMRYIHLRAEPVDIPLRPDDPVKGPIKGTTAKHTVVIFSDFQCPSCGLLTEFFEKEVVPLHGVDLRVVFKHFPLDKECNRKLPSSMHDHACEAAYAAEAARELGGSEAFWKMHDLLFEKKEDVADGRWAELGTAAGLDGAAVAERVAQKKHRDRVETDVDLGFTLKLTGTPSVYIDGRPLENWTKPELWTAILTTPDSSAAPAAQAPAPAATPAAAQ